MLKDIFCFILQLSLTGAVIAAAIIIVKKLTGKIFSARWHYFLWFLLLIKLLVPFSLSSSLSLFNIYKTPTDFSYYSPESISKPQVDINFNTEITDQPLEPVTESKSPQTIEKSTPATKNSTDLLDICAYIWLCGVIALLIAAIVSYWRIYRRTTKVPCPYREYIAELLRNCTDDSDIREKITVRYSKHFLSPFTFGILDPCIVIPDSLILDKQKLEIILMHELVHIKRHDHTTRVLTYILQAIHWFNPLVWISFKLMAKDCEVSCDSVVIKEFDENMRNKYAMMLVETAQMINAPKNYVKATAFGESNLKKRIHSITKFKKHSIISAISSVLVFAALTVVLITSANANDNILNERFGNIQTIKISYKNDPNLIRVKNLPVQSYNSLDQNYFTLSIYNPKNILLFNINNIEGGTYVEKVLNAKSNKKECRMFYDIITKKSKEKTLIKSELFYDMLYTVEITYKDGKVDYLSTDSKYGQVYKTLKNGKFIAVRNTELLDAINKYSAGLLSGVSDDNLTATTYYGVQDAESLGISRPRNGSILQLNQPERSSVYGKATINLADKTAKIEIETSLLSKIKKGNTVSIANFGGSIKNIPDIRNIKGNTCIIEADMELPSRIDFNNLEFDAEINCFAVVPIGCIIKGNNGKQYAWVSYKHPKEIRPNDNNWVLEEIITGESNSKLIEVTKLYGMDRFGSIFLPA